MDVDYEPPIFHLLRESLREKKRKRLRFAKCAECGRVTIFRFESIYLNAIRCKRCGNLIFIAKKV